jgi:hypothetical protein
LAEHLNVYFCAADRGWVWEEEEEVAKIKVALK